MFASFLFGLYHHFLAMSPDHVRSQPASFWGAPATALRWLYEPETPSESSPLMVWPN
jgi:hypothetical protein